ncbi:MAG: peptidylprolyl isomerase [Myxococcota bacterium]
MHLSLRIGFASLAAWVLVASACSNLTTPAGEDPDNLPPVGDKAAPAATQPRRLPNAEPKAKERAKKPEQALVRRILVAYKGAAKAKAEVTRSKDEAKKLASELSAELKKPKADFAALAKKHSDAPEAARGGLMPVRRGSRLDPAFESAAFRTKVGQTSGVLETTEGFLIVQRLR